jgi:archaellum biogenesis ATPase FlaH
VTALDHHTTGTPDASRIPATLKVSPRFVLWKYEDRDGKPTKVPYQTNGKRASSTNKATWTTFDDVITAVTGYDGIGIMLGDGLAGIDLDHCRDAETGVIDEWAQAVIDHVDSYTEVSPSGEGIHILVTAGDVLPETAAKRRGTVEFYQRDRYLTVTGNAIGNRGLRNVSLAAIHAQLFPYDAGNPTHDWPSTFGLRPSPSVTDDVVVAAARKAANGDATARLLDGDYAGYESPSEARFALVNRLAFFTQDEDQLVRLIEQAGFDREKDGRTARNHDIPNALLQLRETWSGPGGEIRPVTKARAEGGVGTEPTRIRLVDASDVMPESVDWAWDGRIPLGMLTLIVGQGGEGKSMETHRLAAGFSRGTIPGALFGTPVHVAIASAEDHRAVTIVPRLIAAGADLTYIHFVEAFDSDGDPDDIAIDGQIADLERTCRDGQIRVLLVDTVVAHIPTSTDTYKEQHVRAVLKPLSHMAERLDLAVVGVMHLNRREARDVLTRISGSGGFGNLARSVLLFAKDPEEAEDSPVRILAHAKCNVGRLQPTLRMRITERTIDGRIATAHLVTDGESRLTTAQLLTPRGDLPALDEAERFLTDRLSGHPEGVLSSALKDEAVNGLNIASRTLDRARSKLGVISFKPSGTDSAMSAKWLWKLPSEIGVLPTNYRSGRDAA